MYAEIPEPITFNPFKHHFRFLLKEVERWNTTELIKENLLQIGNNLTDFYIGKLTVYEICNECSEFFSKQNISNYAAFNQWLDRSHGQKIRLSDGSDWLIRKGENKDRYIHLHPAKFSRKTIRVRATTLKTVLALIATSATQSESGNQDLRTVNKVRTELLSLSPVKTLHPADSGILRLLNLFERARKHPLHP